MAYDLEFEKPLAELDKKITALRKKGDTLKPGEREQLERAEYELQTQAQKIYSNLSAWQTVQLARHQERPHAVDYLRLICDDFVELRGDRSFGDNPTIVSGPARFGGQTVMFACHEKGRTLKERQHYNAGMARPEGFRKAYRLMQQAEKFHFPIICLIDTPGASITLDDEARGQSRAIAANLALMARLHTPIIAAVIGEGGSGGALALSVADRILALEHTYYAVAAPESSAMIVWRSEKFAPEIAEGQRINARQLYTLGLIDEIVPEPLGGAHRDYHSAAHSLKKALLRNLEELQQLTLDELLERRYQKFRTIGPYQHADVG